MKEPDAGQERSGSRDPIPSGAPDPSSVDHGAVAAYIQELVAHEDDVLIASRSGLSDAGMRQIQVPPATGKALQVLVAATGARRVIEVGTLGGYSAIWMARGMPPDGRILSLELLEENAAYARRFIEQAGLSDRIEVRVGDAREVLAELGPDGSYDVMFLDADKESYLSYLEHAARLLRPGGLLLADNVVWRGEVLDPVEGEASGYLHAFNRAIAGDGRFLSTILQVGDGLAVGVRL